MTKLSVPIQRLHSFAKCLDAEGRASLADVIEAHFPYEFEEGKLSEEKLQVVLGLERKWRQQMKKIIGDIIEVDTRLQTPIEERIVRVIGGIPALKSALEQAVSTQKISEQTATSILGVLGRRKLPANQPKELPDSGETPKLLHLRHLGSLAEIHEAYSTDPVIFSLSNALAKAVREAGPPVNNEKN